MLKVKIPYRVATTYNFDDNFDSPLGILFNIFFDTMDGKYGDDLFQYSKSEWFLHLLKKQIKHKWKQSVSNEDLIYLNTASKYAKNNIDRIDMFTHWLNRNNIPWEFLEYKLKLTLTDYNDNTIEDYIYQRCPGSVWFSGSYIDPYIKDGYLVDCRVDGKLDLHGNLNLSWCGVYIHRKIFVFKWKQFIGHPMYKTLHIDFVPYTPTIMF